MFPLYFVEGIAAFYDDISPESVHSRVLFEIQVIGHLVAKPRYARLIY